jgi:hypothetical protein
MQVLGIFNDILNHGFGPFLRQDNPLLYPFVLAALVLSVLLGIVNFFVERKRPVRRDGQPQYRNGRLVYPTTLAVLVGEVIVLAVQLASIYLIWLAYATPFSRLPFAPPAAGTSWLGLPADLVYLGLAVIVHGILSLVATYVLIVFWLTQFHISSERRLIVNFALLIGLVLVIYGWEVEHWPIGFLVPAELVVSVTVGLALVRSSVAALAVAIGSVIISPFRRPDPKSKEQFELSLALLAQVLGSGFIMLTHPLSAFWIDLFGIYYTLTLFDSVVASFIGVFLPRYIRGDVFSVLSTPDRFPVAMFLIAVTALAGAGGIFASLTLNPGVTAAVWLQAGAAALAYALFRPLTTQVQWKIFRELARKVEDMQKGGATTLPPSMQETARQLPWLNFPAFFIFR